MAKTSFKDQIDLLTMKRHRLAVWEAVHSLLDDDFISKDGRSAKRALRAPGALTEVVPEDVIEDILREIGDGPIAEMKKDIDKIENQEVTIREAKG